MFEHDDDESNVGNSGLVQDGGLGSLLVGIQRRTASETECPGIRDDGDVCNDDVDDDCESVAITDEDVTLVTGAGVGYYTLSGMAVKSRVVCKSERKLLDASVRLPWRPPSVREA